MIVTEVCLPSGLKTLVIPIFLPIMPFISLKVYAIGYETDDRLTVFFALGRMMALGQVRRRRPWYSIDLSFNPSFAADLFFSSPIARLVRVPGNRSTGSKQTLNGLFICTLTPPLSSAKEFTKFDPALFYSDSRQKFIDGYIKSLKFVLSFGSPVHDRVTVATVRP